MSSAQWVEGLAAIVQASFSWDAVEAQTLWVLLGSELAGEMRLSVCASAL